METSYLSTAWADLTSNKKWWLTLLIFALLQFIPVFGQMVTYGYLLLWAKDRAWGFSTPMHRSMSEFSEALKVGARAWVGLFVYGLIVSLALSALSALPIVGLVFGVVGSIVVIGVQVLLFVPVLRATIYDSFDPLVQLNPSLDMIKRDFNGLLRIIGVYLIFIAIVTVIATAMCVIVATICIAAGTLPAFVDLNTTAGVSALISAMVPLLGTISIVSIICMFLMLIFSTAGLAVTIRALGIWTAQFKPSTWGPSSENVPL